MKAKLSSIFPILQWLPGYQKSWLTGDLSAGLTVGVMLIPQGMAYAMVAGLPPVYGLYASIVPQLVYAIFGTSRQLAVGPVAMDSLLVAAGVSAFASFESSTYIALAILLSLMVGVIQLAFGLMRMGFLVNFMSRPVISGFTSAAAIIIAVSQLKHFLGISLPSEGNVFSILFAAGKAVEDINLITVLIGIVGVIIVKYAKTIHPLVPGALVAVVVSTIVTGVLELNDQGVRIAGAIPAGLPDIGLPSFDTQHLMDLLPVAFTIALIAFMEAVSVAQAIQAKHKNEYQLDTNQEMMGLGLANIAGSFFSSYPTTGGFSRSAVNDQSGANTNLAGIISAGLIMMTLLFLTPLFYYLPHAILASVIMVAVMGLIDVRYPLFLWKSKKEDFLMLLVTFLATLIFGIKEGIGLGVLLSLVMMIYRSTRPHVARLGRLPGTHDYRNIERFKEIEIRDDLLVVRYDAQLYFANATHFSETLRSMVARHRPQLVVLDCGSISSIDATALQELEELVKSLLDEGVMICFAGLIGPVRDFLTKTGFISKLGIDHFFLDVQAAVDYYDSGRQKEHSGMFKAAVQSDVFRERDV